MNNSKINMQQVTRTQNKRSVAIKTSSRKAAGRIIIAHNRVTDDPQNEFDAKPINNEGLKILARIIARIEQEREKASD